MLKNLYSPGHIQIAPTTEYLFEPGVDLHSISEIIFKQEGIVLIVPISRKYRGTTSCILLGVKKSHTQYSLEDIELILGIAHHAGPTLDRILLQKQLLLEHAAVHRHEGFSKMKSYFVSSLAHDLKMPLTSRRLVAELPRDNKNISRKRYFECLQIIEGDSERLQRLHDNVLDFSKIERGTKDYHFERNDLNEVVKKSIKLFRYQLSINHLKVIRRITKKQFPMRGDTDALY